MNNPPVRRTQAIFSIILTIFLVAVAIYLPYSVLESSIIRWDYYVFTTLAVYIGLTSLMFAMVATAYFKSISKMRREVSSTLIKRTPWLCLMTALCMISWYLLGISLHFDQTSVWEDFMNTPGAALEPLAQVLALLLPVSGIIFSTREFIKHIKHSRVKIRIKKAQLHFTIIMVGCVGGLAGMFMGFEEFGRPGVDCAENWSYVRQLGDGYLLPTGSHYNPSLDNLTGNGTAILDALERVLQWWSKFETHGGYPKAVLESNNTFFGDILYWCPLGKNDISFYEVTQRTGQIFLDMYKLEPNPVYLEYARKAGNAIINAQDTSNGAWWEVARFKEDDTHLEPDPYNYDGLSHYADGQVLSILRYLCRLWEVETSLGNHASAIKYYNAYKKGIENIRDNKIEGGSWHKNSLADPGGYGWGSNLNDDTTVNNIRSLWLAEKYFSSNSTLAIPWAKEMALEVIDWLIDMQGKGGSPIQQGWADQYSQVIPSKYVRVYENERYYGVMGYDQSSMNHVGNIPNLPSWGRTLEPPAMSIRATSAVLDFLFEMWLETGDSTYLDPFNSTITWMELPGMRANGTDPETNENYTNAWYLYYELGSNTPIFGLRDHGGPFDDPQYTYDINEQACCYGYFGYYHPNTPINKYLLANSSNFNISNYTSTYMDEPPNIPLLESDALAYNASLNGKNYWTANKTPPLRNVTYTLIRDWEFYSGTAAFLSYLRAIA
ncbi:MAG: hypothetical protein ACFFCS_20040 [Candidatus Hodarchaeota archaeon]